MKAIKHYALVLFVTLICFTKVLQAQDKTQEALIIGTWVFDYNESLDKIEAFSKTKYDLLPQEQRSRIEDSYRNRKIIFDENNKYSQVLSNGETATGTWKIIKDDKYIEVTSANGSTYIQKIKNITSSHLVLKFENSGKSKMIINEWHLVKI